MTEQEALPWVDFGPHAYRLEPHTDTIVIRMQGSFTAETARMFIDNLRRFSETRATIFILVDASGLGDIPGEVRGGLAGSMKTIPISAAALFGASFAQRVLVTLADKVANPLPWYFAGSERACHL